MMDAQHISQDDLALYALQALSNEESAAVREHLSGCEVCRIWQAGDRIATRSLDTDVRVPQDGGAAPVLVPLL